MFLGEIIKKYREDNHMSMQDFADKSKLSKGYISMLEKNEHPKNKKEIVPSIDTFKKVSATIGVSFDDLIRLVDGKQLIKLNEKQSDDKPQESGDSALYAMGGTRFIYDDPHNFKIPVLGKVAAGEPIEAIESPDEYQEIPKTWPGEYFALKIKGQSMEPKISEGDVVVVKKQECVESGDTAVVLVNNQDATVKKVMKDENGITLVATNTSVYMPKFYSNKDIEEKPVKILGKVVELRGKF